MAMCQSEEGEPWDGSDGSIMFQEAVSFRLACAEEVSRICLRPGQLLYHVVWVHFQFNGFPDDSVHLSSFCREKFCIL
jgi:hypothetical protein